VSTPAAVALTLGVLALSGLLPTLALVGPRLVALPLCPLAGSVLCALAAACTIGLSGTLGLWFVVWSAAAAVLSFALTFLRFGPDQLVQLLGEVPERIRREVRPAFLLAALALVAAVAWALRTVRVPNVGFDTRAIWLLHARWLSHGHSFALAALRNRFDVVSHPSYPPLVSAVMALTWRVSGTSSDRVAVVMVASLNACALFVAGWGLVEAARRSARRTGRNDPRFIALGGALAVLLAVVAGGELGSFGTNGYADPLWSLAAVAAVLYGLVLKPRLSDLGVAAIVIGVAGLSKVEGTAIALVLVVAIAVRRLLQRPAGQRPTKPLLALVVGVLALIGWPVLTLALGVPKDANISGTRDGSLWDRARATFDAASPHLHVVELAALIGLAGLFLLRRRRGRLGLGNDLWSWAILLVAIVVLGGAYVFGPGDVELWLSTSVDRTTIFVALMGWWIVAVWALCGVSETFLE
jgi:MYXO-CTERM domain-containing protein